jgi:hypothetical protein
MTDACLCPVEDRRGAKTFCPLLILSPEQSWDQWVVELSCYDGSVVLAKTIKKKTFGLLQLIFI